METALREGEKGETKIENLSDSRAPVNAQKDSDEKRRVYS